MSQNRASGINIIGDAPWGTHFCQFYQTKEDLIDILVPYLKAGLENNEFCMWVTSEPLGVEEAKEALKKPIPDFDAYLEKGQIEIIPYTYWYVIEGVFDSDRVLKGWIKKLNKALANGYDGLRLTGNTLWLEKEDWNGFVDYEEKIDRVLGNYNIIALCTYSLDRCSATEIIDVVANHQFALIKKEGKWEQIQSSRQKLVEESLHKSEERLRLALDAGEMGTWDRDFKTGRTVYNERLYELLGLDPEGITVTGDTFFKFIHNEDLPRVMKHVEDLIASDGSEFSDEFRIMRHNGQVIWLASKGRLFCDINGQILRMSGINYDITERKLAEEKLRGSEERYRELFESSVDGIIITDLAGNILRANHAYAKMLGYSMEELRHFNYQQLTPTRWHESEALIIREQIFEHGYSDEYEKEYIRKDGSILPISIRVWLSRDKQGQPLGMWGIVRDITERKRAEEALKESEVSLAKAQSIAHLANWELDIRTNIICGSEELYHMFNIKPDVSLEAYIEKFHPEDRARVVESINAAIYEGKPYSIDYRIIPYENVIRNVHAKGEITNDDNGIPIRFFGTVLDITERKQIEDALKKANDTLEEKVKERTSKLEQAYESLKESEKSLAEAQEMAHLGNWDRNLVTNELYWSNEMRRIFGLNSQEFIVTYDTLLNHLHPEDRDYVDNAVKLAIKGKPFSIDYRIISADGKERVVHAQGKATFDEKNNPVRIRGVVQDITERKKAQEALERMDKIRIKEIHHRIKNNLQVISSLLDLQAEKFEEEKVKEAFREGQNRVISMSLLHEELYKGEGADTLDFSAYLKKLARNLFSIYNLYSKNVRLSMDLGEDAFLGMDAAVPLGIIVNELISNSLKHAFNKNEAGEIQIKFCRNEETSDEVQKSVFSLTISDDGKGIPEDLEIENAESLGLQLVGILVDQLDGELELKRDNGTEFTIKFNVKENNKTSVPAREQFGGRSGLKESN